MEYLKRQTLANVKDRLTAVPYLQPSLVDFLGSSFDLHPKFFHAHLGFPFVETADPLRSDPALRILFNFDYVQNRGGPKGEYQSM